MPGRELVTTPKPERPLPRVVEYPSMWRFDYRPAPFSGRIHVPRHRLFLDRVPWTEVRWREAFALAEWRRGVIVYPETLRLIAERYLQDVDGMVRQYAGQATWCPIPGHQLRLAGADFALARWGLTIIEPKPVSVSPLYVDESEDPWDALERGQVLPDWHVMMLMEELRRRETEGKTEERATGYPEPGVQAASGRLHAAMQREREMRRW